MFKGGHYNLYAVKFVILGPMVGWFKSCQNGPAWPIKVGPTWARLFFEPNLIGLSYFRVSKMLIKPNPLRAMG